ncbi:unnamed protein product, partial [Adineta steineri]
MGTYPINAVRSSFGREFLKMEHDTINVTLRFPGDRVAQFIVGYAAAGTDCYKIVGTK